MPRTVTITKQRFEEFRRNDLFYIDKTRFIQKWWDAEEDVTLITRPRRFGKTLMLDTVKCFFSLHYAGQTDLFEGLAIWKDERFHKLQGTMPVIALSFADIKSTTYETTRQLINEKLEILFDDFDALLDHSLFSDRDAARFARVQKSMDESTAQTAVQNLSRFLVRQHYAKPLILLDEYDSPLEMAWLHGFWDELVAFMRGFFNATFKSNPYAGRCLMTGITRVSRESLFSDMNNLDVVSTTSDRYADCFGFTEDEVFLAMDEYGLTEKRKVKQWYDGFIFGKQSSMYNPWSIVNYLKNRKFADYWAKSSSHTLLGQLIGQSGEEIKQETAALLGGESIRVIVDEDIVFSHVYTVSGALWSLLMAAGYVKSLACNLETHEYTIALTNYEVFLIFKEMIANWFSNQKINPGKFRESLLSNNLYYMNESLRTIAENTFSFFDTSKKEPERFYHAFILGLIVDLDGRYTIKSNRESGLGRYDIIMIPEQKSDHGIIIEFKVYEADKEKSLTDTCTNALRQICAKRYTSALKEHAVSSKNIYIYGFAFKGKEVLICGGSEEEYASFL